MEESKNTTVEGLLERLGDPDNYPDETLAPYAEFSIGANVYYFTPGGFLYRKDPGTEGVGGFFCGYLSDEAWHYRTTMGERFSVSFERDEVP